MTTRFPASGEFEDSATFAAHSLKDGLRAGLEQEASDVFAESSGLLGRCGGTLPDILRTVHRTNAGLEDEFAAFRAGPGAEGNLAATLQGGEQ